MELEEELEKEKELELEKRFGVELYCNIVRLVWVWVLGPYKLLYISPIAHSPMYCTLSDVRGGVVCPQRYCAAAPGINNTYT